MKLELFDFIDETLNMIEEKKEGINEVADKLEYFFTESFSINDYFLNVNSRIKSEESLREKILRDNFFIKYKTSENLINNLSDLIGIRIECRFIEDEKKIYKDILNLFKEYEKEGYYSSSLNSNIMLRLDDKQPQLQKNGFGIYKIGGIYKEGDVKINFELQIKSLVNVFWGEIDHRVLYKNFNYMLTEDFFKDIMFSIKDNLSMIDRQLMLVFDHLNGMDASNSKTKKEQLKSLLSKIIHDVYIVKIKQEFGFVIDFKKATDVIVDYIFMKDGPDNYENYSEDFLRVLNRLNKLGEKDIIFNKYIEFDKEIFYNDEFTRKIGTNILRVINKDFKWNLFFKIIFDIEEGNAAEDFQKFLIFVRYRFYEQIMSLLENREIKEGEKEKIVNCILENVALNFCENLDVDYLYNYSIDALNKKIEEYFLKINNHDEWIYEKQALKTAILSHKF